MSEKKGFLAYLGQAWLVLLLSVAFGAALAGVEKVTRPRIERNIKEKIARLLEDVFGEGTETDEPTVVEVSIGGKERKVKCYPAIRDGKQAGWGIEAVGQGYDTLSLLVCVDTPFEKLVGYRVIKSLETAGIGDKIERKNNPQFVDQFAGKDVTRPLKPVPEGAETTGNEVWTISGATYSSKKGVVGIINDHFEAVRPALAGARKEAR